MSTATVTLAKDPTSVLPAGSAAYAATTVTLTDSAGAVQTASLNGTEVPPFVAVFQNVAAVAGGAGTVAWQDVDANGAAIPGFAGSVPFTEVGPPTFNGTTGATVAIT